MTNDGWGNEWPVVAWQEPTEQWVAEAGHDNTPWPVINHSVAEDKPIKINWSTHSSSVTWDLASQNDVTSYHYLTDEKPFNITGHVVCNVDKDGNIDLTPLREKLKSQGSNLVDDQAYLYFQCEDCNDILDPQTKSFAKLEQHRFDAGWKVKWNLSGFGYKVYCAKCGEKM